MSGFQYSVCGISGERLDVRAEFGYNFAISFSGTGPEIENKL
jgi:hypothetical protein